MKLTMSLPLFFQLFRFGIVGFTAASINFSIVVLLVHLQLMTPQIANIFAFMIAVQMSYWGHRLWTFSDTNAMHRAAFPKLLTIQILNLIANEALFSFFLALHFSYQIALIIVLTTLPIFTFIANKLWVFK